MKIRLGKEEVWPAFFEYELGLEVELPDDLWSEYVKAFKRLGELNYQIRRLYDATVEKRGA